MRLEMVWRVVGHLVVEVGRVQIMWDLAGLLRTLDYKLSEMRTPSGEVKAEELHIIYVLKICDYYMNNKLGRGAGAGRIGPEWKQE